MSFLNLRLMLNLSSKCMGYFLDCTGLQVPKVAGIKLKLYEHNSKAKCN